MPKIVLIRHGRTRLNDDKDTSVDRIRAWSDVSLSDEGRKEAKRTANQLEDHKPDVLVHSDLSRASETAKIIGHHLGIKTEATKKLRPWDLGKFTGKTTKEALPEIAEYVKQRPDEKVPKGESFDDFRNRAFQGVHDAIARHPGKKVGLVTHHRVERLLKAWTAKGQPADHSIDLPTFLQRGEPTGKSELIDIKEGKTMAEEKSEEKKGRRSNAMYDHDRSKERRSEKDGESKAEKKAEPKEEKAESREDGEHPVKTMHERHASEREALHKGHETERRDMHGNQREEHRSMHARHEKAHKDMAAKHMAEMQEAEAGNPEAIGPGGPGGTPGAPIQPAGAPVAPVGPGMA